MDIVLTSKDKSAITINGECKANALLKGGRSSTIFCTGEDKELLNENITLFVTAVCNTLAKSGVKINTQCLHQVLTAINSKLVKLPAGGTLEKCHLSVFRMTIGYCRDGIASFYITYFPYGNRMVDQAGKNERPEYILAIPINGEFKSIFRKQTLCVQPVTQYCISRDNLSLARTHLMLVTNKQLSTQKDNYDYAGEIPEHANPHQTVVDTIKQPTNPRYINRQNKNR